MTRAGVLILLMASACGAANVFTSDPNFVALWNFESGALTTDSSGNGNTLTPTGSPAADDVNFVQGVASCDFPATANDQFAIADASLPDGFPFKSNDISLQISVSCWFRFDDDLAEGEFRGLWSKDGGSKYTIACLLYRDANGRCLRMLGGYNSGNSYRTWTINAANGENAPYLIEDQWYHLTVTYHGLTKSMMAYVWDGTTQTADGPATIPNSGDTLNVEDSPFTVGKSGLTGCLYWNGQIDEVVVFNDILTEQQAIDIRSGTFGATSPGSSNRNRIHQQYYHHYGR